MGLEAKSTTESLQKSKVNSSVWYRLENTMFTAACLQSTLCPVDHDIPLKRLLRWQGKDLN